MRFDIITIFPGFFAGFFEHGIVRRAQAEGLVSVGVHDLRNFTHDRHRTVDDRPFGGGEGMVLKPEPLAEALESLGIGAKIAGRRSQVLRLPTAANDSAQDDNPELETRVDPAFRAGAAVYAVRGARTGESRSRRPDLRPI